VLKLDTVARHRTTFSTPDVKDLLFHSMSGNRPNDPIRQDWRIVIIKVKLSLCLTKHHAVKTYWGVQVLLHAFLDLGTRLRWVVSFTTRPLNPQGKSPRYPLDRRLGGSRSRSGRGVEEKNSQPLPGIETQTSDRPARSQWTNKQTNKQTKN
jgi:hypothetical protein